MENTIYINAIVQLSRTSNCGKVMFSAVSVCLFVHIDNMLYRHVINSSRLLSIITRQQNCDKVIFSVVSVCLFTGGSNVIVTHDALDLIIHGARTSPPKICTPPSPRMFKLVHYEARTVGKRTVGILQECFLVFMCSENCQIMLRVRQKRRDMQLTQHSWQNLRKV